MQVNVQNRSVLYEPPGPGPVLVPEGLYEAALVDVRRFANAFGERAGLVFEIVSGPHAGTELMESAALKDSPRGKLATLLRGLGGADGSLLTAQELIGRRCQIAVRHGTTKAGKAYAAIVQTFR
jgi:hypothetical protein